MSAQRACLCRQPECLIMSFVHKTCQCSAMVLALAVLGVVPVPVWEPVQRGGMVTAKLKCGNADLEWGNCKGLSCHVSHVLLLV